MISLQPGVKKGFTLIELLIVLSLVSALSALVAPNIWNSYQRSSEYQQIVAFANELMALRRQAHFDGSSLYIPGNSLVSITEGSKFPRLPVGWRIESHTNLFFLSTGVTNGGAFLFISPVGRGWELSIKPLDGQLTITRR